MTKVSEKELEIDNKQFFPNELDFPKRPPWSFDMSKEKVEAKEQKYFTVKIMVYELQLIIHLALYYFRNILVI